MGKTKIQVERMGVFSFFFIVSAGNLLPVQLYLYTQDKNLEHQNF